MIDTRTSIRGALRQRQRGFIINPFSFGAPPPAGNLYDEILAAGPWAYYQLGEAAGPSSYADSSGNARNLDQIVATVTAGSTALVSPGTSADFNGTGHISSANNAYGTAQATAFNGDLPISFVFVINWDSISPTSVPIHLGNVSVNGSQGVFAQVLTTGALRFQMLATGVGFKFFDTATGLIVAGNSYIVHMRRATGGAAAIFLNGTSVATSTAMTGSIAMAATSSSGGQRIMVGAQNAATPAAPVNGRMQHAAVFAKSLSDAEIAAQKAASGL